MIVEEGHNPMENWEIEEMFLFCYCSAFSELPAAMLIRMQTISILLYEETLWSVLSAQCFNQMYYHFNSAFANNQGFRWTMNNKNQMNEISVYQKKSTIIESHNQSNDMLITIVFSYFFFLSLIIIIISDLCMYFRCCELVN